ncbi:MAG TPA: site-specific integrase [Candidatus Competibacteraceae bacterium]|nr:site-specific integrase [Candidatus Competibacteraceae bacterium]HRZ05095.1 site-specific integrase [Candidatus Competibacteraceae bacterium]HSA47559.1 site-specific integrase [Candidatus Competibacteraceae bacterium]
MSDKTLRFTMKRLEALEPAAERYEVRDTGQPGLVLRISPTGHKSYSVGKGVGRHGRRIKIADFSAITLDEARKRAKTLLGDLANGIDPITARRKARAQSISLKDALADYLKLRPLKPGTRANYQRFIGGHLKPWLERPLLELTERDILRRFQALSESAGPGCANQTFKLLNAVIHFTLATQGMSGDSPVKVLSRAKVWHRLPPRTRCLSPSDLAPWWNATGQVSNPVARDYLRFLLLTGLRRNEAARLRWPTVQLADGTLTITDTKNSRPLVLPITAPVNALLQERLALRIAGNDFVFPGDQREFTSVQSAIDQVTEATGIKFSSHDLRRTWASLAQDWIPYPQVKALLNHSPGGDVTLMHYAQPNRDQLRAAAETVATRLMSLCQPTAAEVIPIRRKLSTASG